MKIALLNLPFDNNYGGNLQRYALIKTLQGMGHEVTHVNLRFAVRPSLLYMALRVPFRLLKKLCGRNVATIPEWRNYKRWQELFKSAEPFYNKHIPHTKAVASLADYKKYEHFEVVLVGSDQVWRKRIAQKHLFNLFMDFLPTNCKQKRIAYGVSLGTKNNELKDEEIATLRILYNRFDAVSVREASALTLFDNYGWTSPKATQVLDPTLLLDIAEYKALMPENTKSTDLFCYVLDMTGAKKALIEKQAAKQGLTPVIASINQTATLSVGEWLNNFYSAQSVITDSFHGMVFSIIFHKPFIVVGNEFRGMERFTSLLSSLGLMNRLFKEIELDKAPEISPIDWNDVDNRLNLLREISIDFLKQNL